MTGDQETPGWIEGQRSGAIDEPRAEFDRRQMAFSDGTQGHDEATLASLEAGLVGRKHDRRIEEGGCLHRVLVGEVGADEQAPFVG
jgi:hypothetical protein